MIDWLSLLIVAAVSICATAMFAVLLSVAIRLLSAARASADGDARGPAAVGAWILLGLIGLMVLFALYLIIPQFH